MYAAGTAVSCAALCKCKAKFGDPEYYGRFWGFSAAPTQHWDLPGPFDRHRLLVRCANPAVRPERGMLGPWLG